ncbi:Mucin-5AC [Bagarius yarrelli]|uniref:Mucin-5AC n=1 Tax=Bagarius yarrelli TaxID=175774 RepID=A0A556U328_BAGYA|nr:Mucin-5AC [Bagarius yarrelli]
MVYSYNVHTSTPSCRCLSDPDFTCAATCAPVDGCVCANGTYLDDNDKCVTQDRCSCYYKGTVIPPGEVISKDGVMCTCKNGKISCIGSTTNEPSCFSPTVFFNCSEAAPGSTGSECQKSCNTLDMTSGLVSDGKGGCIEQSQCPCVHNSKSYQPGESINIDCNTCTCKDRKWECSTDLCHGTCTVYGDGHYITFDGKRYTFDGDCEYTLVRDNCGYSNNSGTFRVITENLPCGTTGTTCSKAIKLFLGTTELLLKDGDYEVIQRDAGNEIPYQISVMGIYMVIEAENGLILMWDQKTSIFIKISPTFKGKVCGLCGNYDGNANNDFTLRNQGVVNNALDFGNSWKESSSCPDASQIKNPCTFNPYRQAWAQKTVDPAPYYSACVRDACACDTGGDCECFCTAIAAYAEACNEAEVCVAWRTPKICPLFCDYYNPPDECEWHYKPCGAPCMKTCRNPEGKCSSQIPPLEGCYPKCPDNQPYFDEDTMKCVNKKSCGCYYKAKHYNNGDEVPSTENCQKCYCSSSEIECKTDDKDCTCLYNGVIYHQNETIYNTTDGYGHCITATCGKNGKIKRERYPCYTTLPPTTTVFDFSSTAVSTTHSHTPTTTTGPASSTCQKSCHWSVWYDITFPTPGPSGGDSETYKDIKAANYRICDQPSQIECRAEKYPNKSISEVGQKVECNVNLGLICKNDEQSGSFPLCLNYQIRVYCCDNQCTSPTTPPTTTTTTLPTTVTTTQPTTTPKTTSVSTTTGSPHCEDCSWTPWMNVDYPKYGPEGGDNETIKNIIKSGRYKVCENPAEVECQAVRFPGVPLSELHQNVTCSKSGLLCENKYQILICLDYEVRAKCCEPKECTSTTKPPKTTTTTTTTTTTPPTTTQTTPTTTTTTTPTTTVSTTLTTPTTTTITTTPTTTTTTTNTPTTTISTTLQTTTTTTTTTTKPTTTTTSTTTTVPATSSPTSTKPSGHHTTSCIPKCSWSEWMDFGPPTPGPKGGENVTIQTIHDTYHNVCSTPAEAECRAKLYPKFSLSELGQVVTCNAKDGLICVNENQGLQQQCFDYEIRVSCCEVPKGCPQTSPTTTSTTGTVTTTTPTSTRTTSPTTTPPTTTTTTTTTTPPTTTTSTTTTTPATSSPTSTKPPGHHTTSCIPKCSWSEWMDFGPPTPGPKGGENVTIQTIHDTYHNVCSTPAEAECRHGQTIPDGKCANFTCNDGIVTHEKVKCEDAPLPVCVNQHPAKLVKDDSGCCSVYKCQCICSGFGDPHYITFDGTYYPFQGNCSYVLVKEINPKYHFSVIIDNVFCDSEDGLSCPKSLTVYYKSFEIFMTQEIMNGTVINLIKVNNKIVKLPYQNKDFRVTDNGIESLLVIPEIEAQITFTGMMFFINLPWQMFHGNTEGQCGTCDNNRSDDCRLPNGTILSSCEAMAPYWNVSNDNSICPPPKPKPTPVPCKMAPICQNITNIFKECHELVPYQAFMEGCIFDVCNTNIEVFGCISLQMYAEQCALAGVCIDWRAATNGVCDYKCESPKVYKACELQIQETCDLRFNLKFISTPNTFSALDTVRWEGCYCPDGMSPLNPYTNTCVNSSCVCDTSLCPSDKPTCAPGFSLHVETKLCCPVYSCVAEPVCVFNDTVFRGCEYRPVSGKCCGECVQVNCVVTSGNTTQIIKPGVAVPKEKCNQCVCTDEVDLQTQLHKITCSPQPCQTHCQLGYEYQPIPDECCGKCVQNSCVFTYDNKNQVVKGTIVFVDCCPKCTCTLKNRACDLTRNFTYLESNGCRSAKRVEMTACEGSCVTSSFYSMADNTFEQSCSCCQEVSTSRKEAEFLCPDGSKFTRTYVYVEKCSCLKRECKVKEKPPAQQKQILQ